MSQLADFAFRARKPEDVAIIEVAPDGTERTMSFARLKSAANGTAQLLRARGVSPGDRVALIGDNSLAHCVALLGILKAGGVACPINTKLPAADRRALIDGAEVGAVMAEADADLGAAGQHAISFDEILDCDAPGAPEFAPSPSDLALIMYTSGSSGLPKGVPITHAGYSWALTRFLALGDTMAGKTGIVAAPLFHMNGQFHLLNMLSVGMRVVLMQRFDAAAMLAAIERHSVARVTGVPTMAALMADVIEQGRAAAPPLIEQIGLGSAPLSRKLHQRLSRVFPKAAITNGYGTTETGPGSFGPHPTGKPTPPTALGYPLEGVEMRLVGGTGPDDGILMLRNPMTLAGYWKNPEASHEKIDADGWYFTGDLIVRDADGFYYFDGRADDMLQVGGENVHPQEVEARLERHPGVTAAAVVGVPHPTKHEAPVAFVVASDPSLSEDTLKQFAIAHGPAYAHPRRVFFVEVLPLAAPQGGSQGPARRGYRTAWRDALTGLKRAATPDVR